MDTLVCIVFTAFSFLVMAGSIEIENCNNNNNNNNFIDILEDANNTIVCKGFNQSHTIAWSMERTGQPRTTVATCGPSSNCTVHQPDHFAVKRSPSHSTLFYQQYDREVDKVANVHCESQFPNTTRTVSCRLNVINPATLSSCVVEENRESMTVRGRCRFDHAYSYSRGFNCTWYQEKVGQSKRLVGNITYFSGPQGPSGWCNFTIKNTTWEPGTYTYIINFYPGPGNITVNIGNIETTDENSVPVGAIAGGIAAAVGIIVVVVVVVVVIRRKRKRKPAGNPNGSGDVPSKENNDFEEHVNPMYVTSDGQDDTHSTDHKPSAIALRISSNSHNGHPAAPHSLDSDMYTTVDGEARHAPSSEADRSGGYEDISFGSNGNKRAPQKDEYAVVDKSRAKKGPASSENTSISSPTHTTEGSNEYAVVDKSSSRNKAAKNIKVVEPETERAAYAQVQKAKPAVKPETSTKPSSDKDVTCRGAADDDEYHTLSHARGSPHTQGQAELDSQYSHIS